MIFVCVFLAPSAWADERGDTHGGGDLVLILNDLQHQIQREQLRPTQQRIDALLQNLGPNAPVNTGYHRLTKMKAQIYFDSKQYEDASVWATRCHNYLDQFSDPQRLLARERRDVALLLGRIHRARRAWTQSRQFYETALAFNQQRNQTTRDRLWELDVLTELANVLYQSQDGKRLALIADDIEQRIARLRIEYIAQRMSLQGYHQLVRSWMDYVADTQPTADAIIRLTADAASVSDERSNIEMLSKIASLHRTQKQFSDELRVLGEAARAEIDRFEHEMSSQFARSTSPSPRLEHLAQAADLDRRIAAALDDIAANRSTSNRDTEEIAREKQTFGSQAVPISVAQRAAELSRGELNAMAIGYLQRARGLYKTILEEIGRIEKVPDALESIRVTALLALPNVSYRLYQGNGQNSGKREEISAEGVVADIRRLQDYLADAALPTDRRIIEAKMLLGSVYLLDLQFEQAKFHLLDAKEDWINRQPPDYNMVVRTLIRLSEVERSAGSSDRERAWLDEALEVCADHLADDRSLMSRLTIKRGRLSEHDEARGEYFEKARQLAKKAGDPDSELSYNIELVNLAVAQQDVIGAANLLDAATNICEQFLSPHDRLVLRVRDQQALVHFLVDRRTDQQVLSNRRDLVEYLEGSRTDRETARRLWLNILETQQQQNHPPVEQARTLHYLAKLRFRDWLDGLDHWRLKQAEMLSGQTATYEMRRDGYNDRFEQYKKWLAAYRQETRAYDNDLQKYEQPTAGDVQPLPAHQVVADEASQLRTQYQKLLRTQSRLDIEAASLTALKQTLDIEWAAASANAAESSGRFKEDLTRMITEAERLARRALDMCDAADVDLNLRGLIAEGAIPTSLALVAQARDNLLKAAEPFDLERVEGERNKIELLQESTKGQGRQDRLLARVTHLHEILAWIDELPAPEDSANLDWQALLQRLQLAHERLQLADKILHDQDHPNDEVKVRRTVNPEARHSKHDGAPLPTPLSHRVRG